MSESMTRGRKTVGTLARADAERLLMGRGVGAARSAESAGLGARSPWPVGAPEGGLQRCV